MLVFVCVLLASFSPMFFKHLIFDSFISCVLVFVCALLVSFGPNFERLVFDSFISCVLVFVGALLGLFSSTRFIQFKVSKFRAFGS